MALLCLLIGAAWTFFLVPILSLCVDWWSAALTQIGNRRLSSPRF
jgi:hypothetical protein